MDVGAELDRTHAIERRLDEELQRAPNNTTLRYIKYGTRIVTTTGTVEPTTTKTLVTANR